MLGTVLTNATAALADAPSRLTLPDVTAEGGLVRPTPLTPEALPAAAHSTYLDTSLLSLGWINASSALASGGGAALSNLFSVDIRCSLNDSRAAGAAPADAPGGGGGGGTEAALAGKAALRQTADAGSPQQPPPRHEGYMASVALSSLPFSTAIETAPAGGSLRHCSLQHHPHPPPVGCLGPQARPPDLPPLHRNAALSRPVARRALRPRRRPLPLRLLWPR